MIAGIANQVNQRISQFLDHHLVDFSFLTMDLQVEALSGLPGDISNNTWHAGKQRPHWLGTNRHYAILQILSELPQPQDCLVETRVGLDLPRINLLHDQRLGNGCFTNEIKQPLDLFNIDPDG